MRWMRRALLALLLSLLLGLVLGTLIRLRLERPVRYIGALPPRIEEPAGATPRARLCSPDPATPWTT